RASDAHAAQHQTEYQSNPLRTKDGLTTDFPGILWSTKGQGKLSK
ncbi:MAG: hypothetical protein ACJAZO_003074, partial [Myxococcota bacterium]